MLMVIGLLQGAVIYSMPLWILSMGELVEQRSGILGLGIEGTMLMGAFAGYFVALKTQMIWLGMISGLFIGVLAGVFVALFVVFLGRSQIVTGIGLNILMGGLTSYLFVELITNPYGLVPYVDLMKIVPIPYLKQIPIIGPVLFENSILTYGVFLLFPLLGVLLYKTSIGLKTRAVGESAEKCNALGINVRATRTFSVLFAYALAGFGGAALVLGATGSFTHGMTVGRGFLAISIVIVANWSLLGVAFIGFLFGVIQSGQQMLQIYFPQLPWQLLLAAPYLFGIVALVLGALRARQPSELGIPFLRQR